MFSQYIYIYFVNGCLKHFMKKLSFLQDAWGIFIFFNGFRPFFGEGVTAEAVKQRFMVVEL